MLRTILTLILLLTVTIPAFAQSNYSETLTITTYYPSPYGVYHNLEVKSGLAVGGSGYSTVNNLKEGQLFINNSVILNSFSATPENSTGKAGQVISVGGADKMLKFHNGNKWVNATFNCLTNQTCAACPSGQRCNTPGIILTGMYNTTRSESYPQWVTSSDGSCSSDSIDTPLTEYCNSPYASAAGCGSYGAPQICGCSYTCSSFVTPHICTKDQY